MKFSPSDRVLRWIFLLSALAIFPCGFGAGYFHAREVERKRHAEELFRIHGQHFRDGQDCIALLDRSNEQQREVHELFALHMLREHGRVVVGPWH